MVRVNLTLDDYTDKLLKMIALEAETSRSDAVRQLVLERVNKDKGVLKMYGEIVGKQSNK
jgi:endonuclease III-like uncharacterized protein